MSLDGIRVNHGALDQAAVDDCRRRSRRSTTASTTSSTSSPRCRATGPVTPRQSYQRAKAKWDTAIQEMKDLLNETARAR